VLSYLQIQEGTQLKLVETDSKFSSYFQRKFMHSIVRLYVNSYRAIAEILRLIDYHLREIGCDQVHPNRAQLFFFSCTSGCKGLKVPSKVFDDKEPITSPLYPEPYPRSQRCTWLVSAPNGTAVGFKLDDFELATGDYVEIRDGKNESDVLLQLYNITKPRLGHWWTSSGQFLWVRFKSNHDYARLRGFKMKIQFVKIPKGKFVIYKSNFAIIS